MRQQFFVFLWLLFVFSHAFYANAQITGGRANGQAAPTEAKAGSVRSGNYQGDVNLFTGTYSSSYSLGSVSTPTGLSYTAMLTYGGTFSGGNEVPFVSGVPYGEGWNLSLPSISVNVAEFHKYLEWQTNNLYVNSNGCTSGLSNPVGSDSTQCLYLSANDHKLEGSLYWYSPMLNIPGVASGRLVFRGIDPNYEGNPQAQGAHGDAPLFVLHTFDDAYIKAYYRNGEWDVRLPNGTRYWFGVAQGEMHAPSNQRVLPDINTPGEDTDYSQTAAYISVMPQNVATTWYVTQIDNLNFDGDAIKFEYESYGCFNYYKEYKQPTLFRGAQDQPYKIDLSICRDIMLKRLVARSGGIVIEKLEMEYETLKNPEGNTTDMLLLNDPLVHRFDSLYNYKSVLFQGNATPITNGSVLPAYTPVYEPTPGTAAPSLQGWKRYKHVKADGNVADEFASATNPYLFTNNGAAPRYKRETASVINNGLDFGHGFLESPRINFGTNILPAGDVYELRTFINSKNIPDWDFCNFDINIVSGSGTEDVGQNAIDADDYNAARNQTIFTTFNQAIKWNPLAVYSRGSLYTSNFFSMPNIPMSYGGFRIQIGAANSDNIFNLNLATTTGATCSATTTKPLTFGTYPYFATGFSGAQIGGKLKPFEAMRPNFGIGLPWQLVHNIYDKTDATQDLFCTGSTNNHYNFWWNNTPTTAYPNQPTLANNFALNSVELIRYSKNLYMLKRATHYKTNGAVTSYEGTGLIKVAQHELEYTVDATLYYDAYADGAIAGLKNYTHHIVLLTKIKEVPVNPTQANTNTIPGSTSYPTTHLEYQMVVATVANSIGSDNDVTIVNHSSNLFLLTKITNPIGGITQIAYDTITQASVWPRFANPSYWSHYNFSGNDNDLNYDLYAQPKTVAIAPQVTSKTIKGSTTADDRVWTYSYDSGAMYNSLLSMANPTSGFLGVFVPQLEAHFGNTRQFNYELGYGHTVVTEPALTSGGDTSRTEYWHHTDTLQGLLFGKMKQIAKFTPNNTSLQNTTYNYNVLLVHRGDGALNGVTSTSINQLAQNVWPDEGLERKARFYEWYYRNDINSSANNQYLNSYFVRLNREETTQYNPDQPTQTTQTITDYEYWDSFRAANSSRQTTSKGYQLLFSIYGDENGEAAPNPMVLTDEPSWQLFATTTRSPQRPNAFNRTERLYYYDLLNMPYFASNSNYLDIDTTFTVLKYCKLYNMRNLLYEERSLQKAPGIPDTVFNATYYQYTGRWWAPPTDVTIPAQLNLVIDTTLHPPCAGLGGGVAGEIGGGTGGGGTNNCDLSTEFGCCQPEAYFGLSHHPYGTTPPVVPGYAPSWVLEGNNYHLYYCPLPNFTGLANFEQTAEQLPTGNPSALYNLAAPLSRSVFLKRINTNYTEDDTEVEPTIYNQYAPWIFNANGSFNGHNGWSGAIPELSATAFTPSFIELYEVHERNRFGQVVLEEKNGNYTDNPLLTNQTGLFTKFYYTTFKPVYIVYCDANNTPLPNYDCYPENNNIATWQHNIGVPIGMTINWRPTQNPPVPVDSLYYQYQYYPDYSIKGITDPNQVEKGFNYDVYGRLKESFLNNDKLAEYSYRQWQNNLSQSFLEKTKKNYVDLITYTDANLLPLYSRSYIDPLGRKGYNISRPMDPDLADNAPAVISNEVLYDRWDRVTDSYKPREATQTGLTMPTSIPAGTHLMHTNYQADQRSRPTQNYKYGQFGAANKNVANQYRQLNGTQLFAELELNATPLPTSYKELLAPTAGISPTVSYNDYAFFATTTTDEDNKQAIEYVNVAGQKVAVKQFIVANAAPALPTGGIYTLFGYDTRGNVINTINPKGQVTSYGYNPLGWLTYRNTPDAGTTSYTYYVGNGITGQLATETDALLSSASKQRVYTYDHLGRKTQQHVLDQSGQQTLVLLEKQWAYHFAAPTDALTHPNVLPQITNQGKLLGQLSYAAAYDHQGNLTARYYYCYNNPQARLSREVQQLSAAPITTTYQGNVFRIEYPSYNLQGSLKQEQMYQGGDKFLLQYLYEYDEWNRIKATYYDVTNNPANKIKLATYAYTNATGLVRKTTYYEPSSTCPNTIIDTIVYQYDIRNRLTNINSKLFDYRMFYDANLPQNNGNSPTANLCYNGNINATLATYKLTGTGVANTNLFMTKPSTVYGYTYDGLNRLTAAYGRVLITGTPTPGMLEADENTTYDKVGNITTLNRYALSPTLQTLNYTYATGKNTLNTVSQTINGSTQTYRSYTYDLNGSQNLDQQNNDSNATYETSLATTYGRSNLPFRLTKQDGNQIGYFYSPTDARYAKVYPEGNTTNAELYIRDAFGKELMVYNSNLQSYTAYAYGTNRIAHFTVCLCGPPAPNTNQPTAQASRFMFYNHDHLGNTRLTYSTKCVAGVVSLTTSTALDYYPYGKELRAYNSSAEKYKSTHNERDLETGYDFRNARSSTSDAVRFNTVDPMMEESPSTSAYTYVSGNPVRLIDPNGAYSIYVDGMKVGNSAEANYWEEQTELYEADGGGDGPEKTFGEKVDMTNAPGNNKNAAGVPRNNRWFFNQLLKAHPEMFSPENIQRIKDGLVPLIDEAWVKYNPTHVEHMGGKLIHHHVNQGNMATAIPEAVHRKFYFELHSNTGSAKPPLQNGFKVSLRTAGTGLVIVGAANSVYNVATSDNKTRAALSEVSGWGGAYVGAEIGAIMGAPLGPAGAFVGGIIGGGLGYYYGSNAGKQLYDTATGQ